jgi:hypothetical protein
LLIEDGELKPDWMNDKEAHIYSGVAGRLFTNDSDGQFVIWNKRGHE